MAEEQKQFMEISEEIKGLMYSTWLPAIVTTLLEEIRKLPPKRRKVMLTKMCDTCGDLAMAGAVGIQPGMSWDDYLEYLKGTVPPLGPWTIKQNGDVFDLIYEACIVEGGKPLCHCPLLLLGMITEQFPECCSSGSGARLGGRMIEAATKKQVVRAEVVDCPTKTAAKVCHYRVRVKS